MFLSRYLWQILWPHFCNVCFVKVEFEIAIFFHNIGFQIEVIGTFTTVASFVLHNKKLFAVKFVTNSFTCS